MHFHRSNSAERLIDALASLMRTSDGNVFSPETIVVQSRGMERWVSMELSRRLGVWANGTFPFPRTWIEDVTTRVLNDERGPAARFSPEAMQWSIAALLPSLTERPEFQPVAAYVRNDEHGRRTFELSTEIARVLDQYVVFRPKLVADWERGEDNDWQAILWRALIQRHGSEHAAARAQRLIKALAGPKLAPGRLPERVSLFAISTLPPLYVEMLSQLARHMEVHWFLLSPSREYWADIRPQREIWSALNSPELDHLDASELHLTEGQPLLAAWGLVGRDLIRVIDQRCQQLDSEHDDYVDPGQGTLLHALQSDMLHLRDRHAGASGIDEKPLLLRTDDNSLAIHACHNEMREVEVIHDQLVGLLEADPTLAPQDILVMAPDIDRYAPLIDAVFGRGDETSTLPYAISERRSAATRPTLDAFDALLDALGSRMSASTVLDLLSIDLIRERFSITAGELEPIAAWVANCGARWGVDAEHRAEVGQPALRENTWRFGLDRLLLGYAFDGDGHQLAFGVRPVDDVEGNDTDRLGRFVDFCETLFGFRQRVQHDHTLSEWRALLSELLSSMVHRSSISASDHRSLHEALDTLHTLATDAGFERALPLSTVQQQLAQALERGAGSHGFLSSGVTFCRMVPMRSIPFRVIALMGLNHDSFPRSDHDGGLDRSKASRLPGDRSARDDDRQLLLEVVLSARDHLLVTFVGQSVQDNSARPPSVLIDELLDWCARAFSIAGAITSTRGSMRSRLVVTHPLQPWDPRYFGADPDERLFSYRIEHARGSQTLRAREQTPHRFFRQPLPPPVHTELLALRDLEEAINDPVRTLMTQRLGVRLGDDSVALDDREPMILEALDNWNVATPLVELALKQRLPDDPIALLRATGEIPLGTPGQAQVEDVKRDVIRIAALSQTLRAQPIEPLAIDLVLRDTNGNDVRIQGLVRDRFAAGCVQATYSKLDSGQELRTWVRHLAVCAMGDVAGPRDSYLVGRDESTQEPAQLRFAAVEKEQARAWLCDLVACQQRALQSPSLFERRRARAYAASHAKANDHDKAMSAARSATSGFGPSAYVDLAFDLHEPVVSKDDERAFAELALKVYGPLLQSRGTL